MAKTKSSRVHPRAHNSGKSSISSFRSVRQPVLNEQALWCLHLFSKATGVPIDLAMSEALLYWWDSYGGFVVREETETAAYLRAHPNVTRLDYLKWMKMKLWPN